MADYSRLVAALNGISEINGKVWPIHRPSRERQLPCVIYTPTGGENVTALEGWKTLNEVQIDVIATTFETMNRVQEEVIRTLYQSNVIAEAPEPGFNRFDPDLAGGVFLSSIDVVLS